MNTIINNIFEMKQLKKIINSINLDELQKTMKNKMKKTYTEFFSIYLYK